MSSQANITIINGTPHFARPDIERGDKKALQSIDFNFLQRVVDFRRWHGHSTLITSFYRDGDPGAHGEGRAADMIPFYSYLNLPMDPMEMFTRACMFGFKGVGLYFDWVFTPDGKTMIRTTGIHVDDSAERNRPARWFAISRDADGRTVSPLMLPPRQRSACRRLFYYQSPKDGLFYNSDENETLSIDDAVQNFYWNV